MTNQPPERSPFGRRRRVGRVAIAIAGLVLLLVGFVLGRETVDSPVQSERPPSATSPSQEDVGPRTVVDGVPLGYSRTRDGAVAAAIAFTDIMTTAAGEPDEHAAAMQAIAAPEWRSRAAELARNTTDFLRESYPDAELSFAPLRYRVVDYSPDGATIKVWGVTVIFPSGRRPEQAWVTGTLTLAWLDDWRMNGGGSSGGPTPFALESPQDLDWQSVEDFTDVGDAQQP